MYKILYSMGRLGNYQGWIRNTLLEMIQAACHRLMFSGKLLDFQVTPLVSSPNMPSKANGFQVILSRALAAWTTIKSRSFALPPDEKVTQKTALEENDVSLFWLTHSLHSALNLFSATENI